MQWYFRQLCVSNFVARFWGRPSTWQCLCAQSKGHKKLCDLVCKNLTSLHRALTSTSSRSSGMNWNANYEPSISARVHKCSCGWMEANFCIQILKYFGKPSFPKVHIYSSCCRCYSYTYIQYQQLSNVIFFLWSDPETHNTHSMLNVSMDRSKGSTS